MQEVKVAITAVNKVGKSKRDARLQGKKEIHSIKQVKETLSAAQNFAKWVREEYNVKSIYTLTEVHYRSYIEDKKDKGRSPGHVQNIETALRHLQEGMNLRSEQLGLDPVPFLPEKRLVTWAELKKPADRSYTPEEVEAIISHVSAGVKDAVLLCYYMGLRVREAANVQVRHFKTASHSIQLDIEDGRGITKGGRFRRTPVPSYVEKEVRRMMAGKGPKDRLVSVKEATIRKGVHEACKKADIVQDGRGTHGFRHSYCRRRLRDLLREKGIREEGKAMMERIMANRDIGRDADYGILSLPDQLIYGQLKEVIDQVHSEIGHGKDRWDLGERYLR